MLSTSKIHLIALKKNQGDYKFSQKISHEEMHICQKYVIKKQVSPVWVVKQFLVKNPILTTET